MTKMTNGDLKNELIKILSDAGVEDARSDVSAIFDGLLGDVTDSSKISEDDEAKLRSAIKRRLNSEPAAYIVGSRYFYKSRFNVNSNVLIPRNDTELLVETALRFCSALSFPMGDVFMVPEGGISDGINFADWCTGSGCVGISIALELKDRLDKFVLTDISQGALEVASSNIPEKLKSKAEVVISDIFKMDTGSGIYDFITSNPPYITDSEMTELDACVSEFEPHLALRADDNGLAFYPVICEKAMKALKNGGMLAVEHGYLQGDEVRSIFMDTGYTSVMTLKDFGGNDRVTLGIKS